MDEVTKDLIVVVAKLVGFTVLILLCIAGIVFAVYKIVLLIEPVVPLIYIVTFVIVLDVLYLWPKLMKRIRK